jgi:hypothetical protein
MATLTAGEEAAFFLPNLRSGMHLLDVGCGPGSITVGLAEVVAQGTLVGIDLEAGATLISARFPGTVEAYARHKGRAGDFGSRLGVRRLERRSPSPPWKPVSSSTQLDARHSGGAAHPAAESHLRSHWFLAVALRHVESPIAHLFARGP